MMYGYITHFGLWDIFYIPSLITFLANDINMWGWAWCKACFVIEMGEWMYIDVSVSKQMNIIIQN